MSGNHWSYWVAGLLALLVACGDSGLPPGSGALPGSDVPVTSKSGLIQVLSNRSDLISGNDALLRVKASQGVATRPLTVLLNGRDVSQRFEINADGDYLGLLEDLKLGRNTVQAVLPDGSRTTQELVNHPNGGPVIAGPQSALWVCQDGALDAQCNQAPTYRYFYQSSDPTKQNLEPYDLENPPDDVSETTTDEGLTLPFIVREETGYMDRDQYKIAVLYQPGKSWRPSSPQPQFNGKVLVTHGFGCGVSYTVGKAPEVITYRPVDLQVSSNGAVPFTPAEAVPDTARQALGAGFAVISTALDNNSHNCNVVIQAESLMMAKERLIEQYGLLRYTIGIGCSGGSLTQQWVANAYPGIYQGVLPTCSFPDTWTSATQVLDYHLLNAYFGPAAAGLGGTAAMPWTATQVAAVEGSVTPVNSITSDSGFFAAIVPTTACPGTTETTRYHPVTLPQGARCSIADLGINVFAPRPPQVWGAAEQGLGRGFAGLAVDNVGVQYGLSVLQQGLITPEMFLDLNEKVGGLDIDANPTPHRLQADHPALENAYRSGMINTVSNYNQTAIIDCRGPDPGAAHDAYRTYAIRARLDAMHGGHGNHVIWEGPYPLGADTHCQNNSFLAMDRWLSAVEADASSRPVAEKLTANKPADITDACWNGTGTKLADDLCGDQVVPQYATPRIVAGDALTTLNSKCQLKPLNRSDDYGPLSFTDAQWSRMQAVFATGVCDFSRPPADMQATIPWLRYQTEREPVVFGGTRLPSSVDGSGGGWASPAFGLGWPVLTSSTTPKQSR